MFRKVFVLFVFPVQTGNNYGKGTDPMSRVRRAVGLSGCRSVGRRSAKTTGPILTKIGRNIKEDLGILPVPSNFNYVL